MAAECRENPFCPSLPPFGGKLALANSVYGGFEDVGPFKSHFGKLKRYKRYGKLEIFYS